MPWTELSHMVTPSCRKNDLQASIYLYMNVYRYTYVCVCVCACPCMYGGLERRELGIDLGTELGSSSDWSPHSSQILRDYLTFKRLKCKRNQHLPRFCCKFISLRINWRWELAGGEGTTQGISWLSKWRKRSQIGFFTAQVLRGFKMPRVMSTAKMRQHHRIFHKQDVLWAWHTRNGGHFEGQLLVLNCWLIIIR